MDTHDNDAVQLLAPLRDLTSHHERIDVAEAVARGRRRFWTLRVLQGSATASTVTAVVIGSVVLVGGHSPETQPEANAPSTGPGPTSDAPAAPEAPPSSCVVERLAGSADASGGYARAVDPTGRFIAGHEYIDGTQYRAVLWDNGVPTPVAVPGVEAQLSAVNSGGVAVGLSVLGDSVAAWVYQGGAVTQLRGGDSATVIGETGRIAGYRQTGADGVAVVWDSPEADAVDLPVPVSGWRASVQSIAPDGTVVGSLLPPGDVSGRGEVGYLWHPDGMVTSLPMPAVSGRSVIGFRAYVMQPGWIVGAIAFETPEGDVDFRFVRVDRSTGLATEFPEATAAVHIEGMNQRGWYAGSVGFTPNSSPAVASPAGRLDLPVDPDLTDQAAHNLSDDGSIIVGRGFDLNGNVQSLIWRCQ